MILPPLSFSIRPHDANYCPAWQIIGKTFEVLLDGVPVSHVISYDAGEGVVRRYETEADGKLRLIEVDGSLKLVEQTLRGAVTVEWRDVNPDVIPARDGGTR